MAKLSSTNFAAIGKHPIDWKSFLDAKAVKDFYIIMVKHYENFHEWLNTVKTAKFSSLNVLPYMVYMYKRN